MAIVLVLFRPNCGDDCEQGNNFDHTIKKNAQSNVSQNYDANHPRPSFAKVYMTLSENDTKNNTLFFHNSNSLSATGNGWE